MRLFNEYKGMQREVYVIALCKMIDKLGSLVGPMFTLILSLKLGFSAELIAIWLMVRSIIQLPVKLLGGKLADKVNKKLLINICDFSSFVIYILCGFMPISKFTIIIYMFGSLLQDIEHPSYNILLADNTTVDNRERAYSLSYLAHNFGMVLAPMIGGYLLKDYCNLLFIIAGVTELFSLIIFDIYIKESTLTVDKDNEYEQISNKTSLFEILKENKLIILFIIVLALQFAAYNQWNYILPLDMAKTYLDNGSIYFGYLSSLNCFVVILCTGIITKLISRFDSLMKITLAMCFEFVAYIFFTILLKSLFIVYMSMIIFTFGEIIATISSSPYMLNRVPANYRGRLFAFADAIETLIIGLFTLIVGNLYDLKGSFVAWSLIIILQIVVIISLLLLRVEDKKKYKNLYLKNGK